MSGLLAFGLLAVEILLGLAARPRRQPGVVVSFERARLGVPERDQARRR